MADDDNPGSEERPTRGPAAKKQSNRPAKRTAKKATKKATKKAAKRPSKTSAGRGPDGPDTRGEGRAAPRASASRRPKPLDLARGAAEQLTQLTGRQPESTTGIERTDEGWRVELEVVETRRIPDSADILALYEVQLDEDGELLSYRRLRRYPRGRTDPAGGGGR
jgi:hypothetical protein